MRCTAIACSKRQKGLDKTNYITSLACNIGKQVHVVGVLQERMTQQTLARKQSAPVLPSDFAGDAPQDNRADFGPSDNPR